MQDESTIDYSALDRPEVLMFLFHPRAESGSPFQAAGSQPAPAGRKDIMIPVADDVSIGTRFHMAEKTGANLLFFHGNGEIVADYDELGGVYNQMGINFLAVDYRGYGRSAGKPTVSAMMQDCHAIFDFVCNWLQENDFSGPIILMGRSLGSASALELAAAYRKVVDGLIIESGFAYAGPLLQLLGIDLEALGFKEEKGFGNIAKVKKFNKPTLIIHAEYDHIIPFSDGQALFQACPSDSRTFLKIPGANHNDIFMRGLQEYLAAVGKLVDSAR
ncbi:Hydrolase, alpha/beta fold family [Olavius sp. associated proteobacterium Delta 1]|nr:Hydrolase, alpha/beta fold family [Olavius sp. associated proteobacterium Delta 1]